MQFSQLKHRLMLWVLFASLTFFCNFLAAQQNSALTLSSAVHKMLEKHPALRQQQYNEEKRLFKLKIAELRPSTEITFELENFGGSGSFEGTDSAEAVVALSSFIELGGKRQMRSDLANIELDQFAFEREIEKLDLFANLTERFVMSLSFQEKIILAKEHVELLQKVLDTVQKRSEKGIAPEADLMQAKVALSMAENNLESLKREFDRQKIYLSAFWGSRYPDFEQVNGNLFEFGQEKSFEVLFAQAEQSPFIQMLSNKERLSQARIKLEKSANRPDVAWQFGVKQMRDVEESTLVAGVSVPLFYKGRNQSNLAIAQADSEIFSLEKEQALLDFHLRLFEAYSLRSQQIYIVKSLNNEIIPSLEAALAAINQGYENGRYRFSELVKAQEQLIDARRSRIDSATQALLSQSVIEQFSGVALEN